MVDKTLGRLAADGTLAPAKLVDNGDGTWSEQMSAAVQVEAPTIEGMALETTQLLVKADLDTLAGTVTGGKVGIAGAVTNTNLDIALSALRDAIAGVGGAAKTLADVVTQLTTLAGIVSSSKAAVKEADGDNVTLGAKADARSTATDTTAASLVALLKEISYMEQNPASRAVTNTTDTALLTSLTAYAVVGSHSAGASISSATTLTKPGGANQIMIQALTQNVRYTLDGTTPTTSVGFQIQKDTPPTIIAVPGASIKVIEEAATASLQYQWIS